MRQDANQEKEVQCSISTGKPLILIFIQVFLGHVLSIKLVRVL